MLKEKDKRIVLLIVFGVALVSLITAAVACFINGITVLCDYRKLFELRFSDLKYYNTVAYVLLALATLSVTYLCTKVFVRKTFIPSLVLAGVVVCYAIVSTLALWAKIPTYEWDDPVVRTYFSTTNYTYFQTTYVAVAVTLAVATAITEVSHLLVIRMDRKQAKAEAQKEEELA